MSSARKIKLKLKLAKPRNPLVVPALQRKAGVHRKAVSALRHSGRQTNWL